MTESNIEQTFLFPNSQIAFLISENLKKEFGNIEWDGYSGVNIYFDENEEYSAEAIESNPVFQTVIALENTEYCHKLDVCDKKILCAASNIPEQEFQPYSKKIVLEDIIASHERLPPIMHDESPLLFGYRITSDDILKAYQIEWRDVSRRKHIFQTIKNTPKRFICLGAKGLELIDERDDSTKDIESHP